ncbi:hypothetical protein L1049_013814 [Liquidambar formosana]|uniref:FHA domain-containing protein n=1 Tax=Liquidambar formosana TaxID=63359 RepID=A0AAP0RPG5_LIQFO
MALTAHSLSYAKLPMPLSCSTSLSPPFYHSKLSILSHHSATFLCSKSFHSQLQRVKIRSRQRKKLGPIRASDAESTSTVDTDRWLLEPAGDGDWRHIGFEVQMPDAFEIASNVVTVGRVAEKADLVIPVATVSALHARIKKKDGNLLVMDLDSTNGTFIGEKRLRPGAIAIAPPGSYITFGDIHLAMFRVSKMESAEVKLEESDVKPETNSSTENLETTS